MQCTGTTSTDAEKCPDRIIALYKTISESSKFRKELDDKCSKLLLLPA